SQRQVELVPLPREERRELFGSVPEDRVVRNLDGGAPRPCLRRGFPREVDRRQGGIVADDREVAEGCGRDGVPELPGGCGIEGGGHGRAPCRRSGRSLMGWVPVAQRYCTA